MKLIKNIFKPEFVVVGEEGYLAEVATTGFLDLDFSEKIVHKIHLWLKCFLLIYLCQS